MCILFNKKKINKIKIKIKNETSSCAHAFWFSLKFSKREHGGSTYQLATYPLQQALSHPPDELIWNLLLNEPT